MGFFGRKASGKMKYISKSKKIVSLPLGLKNKVSVRCSKPNLFSSCRAMKAGCEDGSRAVSETSPCRWVGKQWAAQKQDGALCQCQAYEGPLPARPVSTGLNRPQQASSQRGQKDDWRYSSPDISQETREGQTGSKTAIIRGRYLCINESAVKEEKYMNDLSVKAYLMVPIITHAWRFGFIIS